MAARSRCLIGVVLLLLGGVVLGAGCGLIADKNLIRVAKFKDHYITRGELGKMIHDVPDDERPMSRKKADLVRVLNDYIDGLIGEPLGEELEAELQAQGKTLVTRDAARQQYFQEHAEDDYASMYSIQNPEAAGMTAAQLSAMKQQIEYGIDRTQDKMRGKAAVAYRALDAFKQGALTATDDEVEAEYRLRKDELKKLEWIQFLAIRLPADAPNSETEAATVRTRLDAGEPFEKLVEEYRAKNADFVLRSEIENNPGLAKFQQFWLNASGCRKGDIIGPVFLPEYQLMGSSDASPRKSVKNMPAAYLVLQVIEHRPETTLTAQEAKPALLPTILISKMMQKLREENGVEVYENKLPDPAMFSDRYGKPFGDGS